METSNHPNDAANPVEVLSGDELERQLELAEQRYATARDACDKVRSELRELANREPVNQQLVKAAKSRLEAVNSRCSRLLRLIGQLEEQLDR